MKDRGGKRGWRWLWWGVVVAALVSCGTTPPTPDVAPPSWEAEPLPVGWKIPADFRIVGYFPSWSGEVGTVRFGTMTHVNYAFALVDATGAYRPIDHIEKLAEVSARARLAGVKVLLSVGGWNEGKTLAFEKIAADPAKIRRFVDETVRLLYRHGLDGVDLDWEYPRAETAAGYTTVVRALTEALRPLGWSLSLAVSAAEVNGRFISDEAWQAADWLNVMAYDDGWDGPAGTPHSSYSFARASLDYWLGTRGVPPAKVVLGVPFYGRSLADRRSRSFRSLVEEFPLAPSSDVAGGFAFNGVDTLKAKVVNQARLRAGGVMVWQLNQDDPGPLSLMTVIYDTVKEPLE